MAVRLSLWQRSLIVLGLALVLFVPAYAYLASQDIDRTLRKFTAGRPVTWPPAAKAGGRDRQVLADRTVDRLAGPGKAAGLGLVVAGLLVGGSRLTSRRRRAGELATFELRLGRDDFSNPFRVQETLEGIVGAISARWYRRLWRGQDHFALEVHRGPTGLVAFTLATRRALVDTIAGALEALYPDVRLIELEGRPSWQAAVTRLKKRRSHVLSLLTLRNYEHAFSENTGRAAGGVEDQHERTAGAHTGPGCHTRTRATAVQTARASAQLRRPNRPARPGHGIRR